MKNCKKNFFSNTCNSKTRRNFEILKAFLVRSLTRSTRMVDMFFAKSGRKWVKNDVFSKIRFEQFSKKCFFALKWKKIELIGVRFFLNRIFFSKSDSWACVEVFWILNFQFFWKMSKNEICYKKLKNEAIFDFLLYYLYFGPAQLFR